MGKGPDAGATAKGTRGRNATAHFWADIVFRFGFFGGIIFTISAAIEQAWFKDSFNPIRPVAVAEQRCHAYTGIAKQIKAARISGTTDPGTLRKIGKMILEGNRSGQLQPLLPAVFGEDIGVGPRSRLIQRINYLGRLLIETGAKREVKGDYLQAIEYVQLGLQVSGVVRFSDYSALRSCRGNIRRSNQILERILPHISKEKISEFTASILPASEESKRLKELARHMNKLKLEYIARYGNDNLVVEFSQMGEVMRDGSVSQKSAALFGMDVEDKIFKTLNAKTGNTSIAAQGFANVTKR